MSYNRKEGWSECHVTGRRDGPNVMYQVGGMVRMSCIR